MENGDRDPGLLVDYLTSQIKTELYMSEDRGYIRLLSFVATQRAIYILRTMGIRVEARLYETNLLRSRVIGDSDAIPQKLEKKIIAKPEKDNLRRFLSLKKLIHNSNYNVSREHIG